MSNFYCNKCGKVISDTPQGYVTSCEHFPEDTKKARVIYTKVPDGPEAETRDDGLITVRQGDKHDM